MIKKLRVKFIFINMAFVSSILAVVLGIFYYTNVKQITRQTKMALIASMELNRLTPAPYKVEFGRRPKENATPLIPTFIVILKSDGTIDTIRENNITVSNDLASTLVQVVKDSGTNHGILKNYSLRYFKITTKTGSKIGFADQSYEWNSIKALIINYLLIFFLAIILFLILSLYLSRLALRPVELAWKQQNQFIADASHELKTPLTVILANLQILTSHKESTIKEQEKWLINTTKETNRMKQLVEGLLFLARSDAGPTQTIQVTNIPLDFSNLILNGTLLFESIAYENKVELNSDIEPDITVKGCESQLKQVITILLDNACKYAEKNGTVDVHLKRLSHQAILSVKNTGELIPPEDQPHLFERFYRADKSRSRKDGGYGLGLSIAKTIIEQHKGKISVTSSLQKGTIFTVTLPNI